MRRRWRRAPTAIIVISKDALEKGKRVATRVTEVAAENAGARRSPACWPAPRSPNEARAAAERLIKAAG